MTELVKVPRGLAGVSVSDTKISKSGADGSLLYRGYAISEIAANAGFEETAYLLLHGRLPKRAELDEFSNELRREAMVDGKVFSIMKELGSRAHPIDVIRTATSALGSIERRASISEEQSSIESKMSVLAANSLGVPRGNDPVLPMEDLGFASRLLRMLKGSDSSVYESWVFERVLIFYLEHDMNASTFTVRVVASTQADPYAAAVAGLSALKGPLHGGANEAAMDMLLEVRDPAKASQFVDSSLIAGKKIMGFGHRVYKDFDPRSRLCKQYLRELVNEREDSRWLYDLCDAIEIEMWERKKIPPNLDYYAAPIFYVLGIDVPLYTPIFAASRVFGWMAHYNEQLDDNKLIRPDSTYIGPKDLKYTPIERR